MSDPSTASPAPRDAVPADYAAAAVAGLSAAWPGWQIWVVRRVIDGTLWCARRRDWRPGGIVLHAGSQDQLTGYLRGETRRAACGLPHSYVVYESGRQPWPAADRDQAAGALRHAGLHRSYVLAAHPGDESGPCRAEALAVEDDAACRGPGAVTAVTWWTGLLPPAEAAWLASPSGPLTGTTGSIACDGQGQVWVDDTARARLSLLAPDRDGACRWTDDGAAEIQCGGTWYRLGPETPASGADGDTR